MNETSRTTDWWKASPWVDMATIEHARDHRTQPLIHTQSRTLTIHVHASRSVCISINSLPNEIRGLSNYERGYAMSTQCRHTVRLAVMNFDLVCWNTLLTPVLWNIHQKMVTPIFAFLFFVFELLWLPVYERDGRTDGRAGKARIAA